MLTEEPYELKVFSSRVPALTVFVIPDSGSSPCSATIHEPDNPSSSSITN